MSELRRQRQASACAAARAASRASAERSARRAQVGRSRSTAGWLSLCVALFLVYVMAVLAMVYILVAFDL